MDHPVLIIILYSQKFYICRKKHHNFDIGRKSAPQDDRAVGISPSIRVEVPVAETQRPNGPQRIGGQGLPAVFGPCKTKLNIRNPVLEGMFILRHIFRSLANFSWQAQLKCVSKVLGHLSKPAAHIFVPGL